MPYGNHGCSGGTIHNTFHYVISVGGLAADKAYRYKAKVSCESCMHILTQK